MDAYGHNFNPKCFHLSKTNFSTDQPCKLKTNVKSVESLLQTEQTLDATKKNVTTLRKNFSAKYVANL